MAVNLPKLTYFPIPGRAEPIRCLCVANDIAFEDHRVNFPDWPALKPSVPFGAIPILTVDGKVIAASNAILRYFGKQCGAYPTDHFQAAQVDAVLEVIEDVASILTPSLRESDPEKKKAMREKFAAEDFPLHAGRLQKLHDTLGTKHFCSDNLSIADYKLAGFAGWIKSGVLDHVPATILDAYPSLGAAYDAVYSQEKVKAYKAQGK